MQVSVAQRLSTAHQQRTEQAPTSSLPINSDRGKHRSASSPLMDLKAGYDG
jgi:hypothetical protein